MCLTAPVHTAEPTLMHKVSYACSRAQPRTFFLPQSAPTYRLGLPHALPPLPTPGLVCLNVLDTPTRFESPKDVGQQ